MERLEVYNVLDGERDYQVRESANQERLDMVEDFNLGSAISAIRKIVRESEDAWYHDSPENNYQNAMEYIRKIGGICVQMGEKYGMPERI